MHTLTIIVFVLFACVLLGGYSGTRPGWGYYGWSPLAVVLLVLVILFLTGNLALG